jgi:photosystem II stability/assembly factor-like uncharacterized protein
VKHSAHRTATVTLLSVVAGLLMLVFTGPAFAAAPGFFGVDFLSATNGWVVGSDATILRTADGGKTWQTQFAQVGGASLFDVCVLADGKTGWAVGASGTVLRTTDGATWTRVLSPSFDQSFTYTSVKFVDAKVGWICGGVAAGPMQGTPKGAIYRTDDGGLTWSSPSGVFPGWCPVALDAVSATSATCVGIQRITLGAFNTPAFVRTVDGKSWGSPPTLLRPSSKLTAEVGDVKLTLSGGTVGTVAVGDYCELLPGTPFVFSSKSATVACGYVAPASGPRQLRGVSMPSATVGYAVGSGATSVLKTANGGASWTAATTAFGKNLFAVDFVSATTGFAVGRTATGTAALVIKTTNSAGSWTAMK